MSSFEQDETDGNYSRYSNDSSSGDTAKPKMKAIRFGAMELGIFVGLWVVMLLAFKIYTRKGRAKRKGWFGPNEEKEAYERALEEGETNEENLKKLLMRRCMTDVRRLIELQEERSSIQTLGKTGAISEDLLGDFRAAEKELELELFEVQAEAETFKVGWGGEIVRDAVRLSRIEDELLAAKRRKEAAEQQQQSSEARSDKKSSPLGTGNGPARELSDREKQKLLEELLEEEKQSEAAGVGSSANVKKRPVKK